MDWTLTGPHKFEIIIDFSQLKVKLLLGSFLTLFLIIIATMIVLVYGKIALNEAWKGIRVVLVLTSLTNTGGKVHKATPMMRSANKLEIIPGVNGIEVVC